ncbi:MAG: NAD-dependent epimerase [Syntrophales bacterium]|nr:NAD-dependent epimerase [Syntrophales bacterium]
MKSVLVTGAAGFIGYHLCERLLGEGATVVGVDNLNPYYEVSLKEARLARLRRHDRFEFHKVDIADRDAMEWLFEGQKGDFIVVVHLAAQAGVRYSIKNPHAYIDGNIKGFMNILEGCRHRKAPHLVFASSSSVYGGNAMIPFSVHHNVDHPVSLYAATKKANELMAHAYADLYGIPCTGLRFFTVYGPWGRPDMALFLFTKAILEGLPIDVYNRGNMRRDFTYIDDIIEGVVRVMGRAPRPDPRWDKFNPDPGTSSAPYRVYNIGNNRPVMLTDFIKVLEDCLGRKATKNLLPMQPGDVAETCADVDDLMRDVGFRPSTTIEEGIPRFVDWYRKYYG